METRISNVLSPNLDVPQAVAFSEFTLPTFWGHLKNSGQGPTQPNLQSYIDAL